MSGSYFAPANWMRTAGATLAPPVAGDTALFNEAGPYTVSFSANAASDVLNDTAGTVTFASNIGAPRTYSLTTGGADASITGSSTVLNIGNVGFPMVLSVGDNLSVQSGGTLNVRAGSSVSTLDLLMGTSGSGLTSSLVVDGAAASFNRSSSASSTTMGQNGATGVLTFRNGAAGDINGTLFVTSSSNDLSAATVNVQSGATLQLDGLNIGSGGFAVAHGDVTVTGSGSSITQSSGSALTIGSAAGNIGNLNIASSGTFNSGTGTITVNATGTVAITGSGTFNANGDMTLDGQMNSHGFFNLAAGKTLTIQNGGDAFFVAGYATGTSSTPGGNITVTGAGSTFATNSTLGINGGSTINIMSGGEVSAGFAAVIVGTSGNGTVTVDGSGSSFHGASLTIGTGGNTGSLTFSNGATGTFGNVDLADSTTAGTMANVTVDSGAMLTTGFLTLTHSGGAMTSATMTVTGVGSMVSTTGLDLGNDLASGTATLNVTSGGSFVVVSGSNHDTSLRATGTININGGRADLNTLFDDGGTINFTAGSLRGCEKIEIGTVLAQLVVLLASLATTICRTSTW